MYAWLGQLVVSQSREQAGGHGFISQPNLLQVYGGL